MIVYTTHLQAEANGAEIRTHQLKFILHTVEEDQKSNPKIPIFLAGDLNTPEMEADGTVTNEYSKKKIFFSQFVDPFLLHHDLKGERHSHTVQFLYQDLETNNDAMDTPEPRGSFYNMSEFKAKKAVSAIQERVRWLPILLPRQRLDFS